MIIVFTGCLYFYGSQEPLTRGTINMKSVKSATICLIQLDVLENESLGKKSAAQKNIFQM